MSLGATPLLCCSAKSGLGLCQFELTGARRCGAFVVMLIIRATDVLFFTLENDFFDN